MKILFVCTGNVCRSPMAEVIVKNNPLFSSHEAKSAGVGAWAKKNLLPLKKVRLILSEKYSIAEFNRSQPVTNDLLDWADSIVCMALTHKEALIKKWPFVAPKIIMLADYSFPKKDKIPDPVNMDKVETEHIFNILQDCINNYLSKML